MISKDNQQVTIVNAYTIISKKQIVLIALLIFLLFICYWPTLTSLYEIWLNDEDYSYALLIPFITMYIIWERRVAIRNTIVSTNWIGGLFFFLFLIIGIYGILGSSPSAVRPSIPLTILSITLFCFGKQFLKILFFPLALLIFMIPLPTVVQTVIGLPLKLVSTKLGEVILRMFSVPVFVEGNVIDLGVTQLQVVDACSGLRYILPLLTLGVLFAYFFEKARWRQILLVLSTIPIAIITNGVRIGITGILAQKYGASVAEGFFHGFSGWLIFMFAFAMLFVFYFFLRVISKKKTFADASVDLSKVTVNHGEGRNNLIPVVLVSVLLLSAGILGYATSALPKITINGGLTSFPMTFNTWAGQPETMDTEMIAASGAEEALTATYRRSPEEIISLYMGFRGSPFTETENFFHSPTVCLPSSGWKTISTSDHVIREIQAFGTIVVKKMVIEKMDQKQLVYFWFQTNKRTSSDVNINRFHLALHAITRENTHDLFIRPITPMQRNESVSDAEKRMDQFVRDMMSILLQFLKEKQIVSGA
jgi:exosortase D (VPLPA-CTERM-specific)